MSLDLDTAVEIVRRLVYGSRVAVTIEEIVSAETSPAWPLQADTAVDEAVSRGLILRVVGHVHQPDDPLAAIVDRARSGKLCQCRHGTSAIVANGNRKQLYRTEGYVAGRWWKDSGEP
jgi:hypothetical protein